MKLGDVGNIAPIVNWTSYVNNILTEEIGIQVKTFFFVLSTKNTEIYRQFSIRSPDSLSLVIQKNKTIEHWWLKVLLYYNVVMNLALIA